MGKYFPNCLLSSFIIHWVLYAVWELLACKKLSIKRMVAVIADLLIF